MSFPSVHVVETAQKTERRQVVYTHVHVLIYAILCSLIRVAFMLLKL